MGVPVGVPVDVTVGVDVAVGVAVEVGVSVLVGVSVGVLVGGGGAHILSPLQKPLLHWELLVHVVPSEQSADAPQHLPVLVSHAPPVQSVVPVQVAPSEQAKVWPQHTTKGPFTLHEPLVQPESATQRVKSEQSALCPQQVNELESQKAPQHVLQIFPLVQFIPQAPPSFVHKLATATCGMPTASASAALAVTKNLVSECRAFTGSPVRLCRDAVSCGSRKLKSNLVKSPLHPAVQNLPRLLICELAAQAGSRTRAPSWS